MMDLFLSVYGEVLATCSLLLSALVFKKLAVTKAKLALVTPVVSHQRNNDLRPFMVVSLGGILGRKT